ncbi:GroES-like protein [Viridothelium virens]|uniref:GroES-like protein n=1 Tax=Viridothelium virens TaxID=1048519 RepID=A0A6A6GWX4_VIRVR|nr:GroES-like protein [Viridothelium virens]
MASNSAAWLVAEKSHPFEVGSAPLWTPEKNEILVKNHAVAINPIDHDLQTVAWWPLNYPTILGHDVAGEVVTIGTDVTQFREGDRVVGHALGMATKQNQHNGFQVYTVLQTNMTSRIPDEVAFEDACVIPLGCSTAAAGLFQDGYLNLQPPSSPPQQLIGQTLLVWGGSSSVGSNAIQLAVAAGYEVIATASPKNFEYVKQLGAVKVLDYQSSTISDDLRDVFKGKTIAGALDCIGGTGWRICMDAVHQTPGAKCVSTTKRGFSDPPEGVTIKHIFATTIKDNKVGAAIYHDFLPKALKAGTFVPAPQPQIAGKGLQNVQGALDLYRKGGVSARKLVVCL